MKTLIQFKTTMPPALVCILLACLTLSPRVQAVVPPPDGGYPGFNTAEGQAALFSLTTGTGNVAVGWGSLYSDAEGSLNTAIGTGALLLNTADQNTATGAGALLFNRSGDNNTANGAFALHLNTTGFQNTATGVNALFSNTIGLDNTASGSLALFHNTIGNNNTANGASALFSNTEGGANTASGDRALFSNITGDYNTSTGLQSLFSNTTGDYNTATGLNALYGNTEGISNTASGADALFNNTNGDYNTANGVAALNENVSGGLNTAVGVAALGDSISGTGNTAIGYLALSSSTGGGNTALGAGAGGIVTTANNVICIGSLGGNVSDTTWIGNIYGVTTVSGTTAPVIVSSSGQLGTVTSSQRFKKNIATMDRTSEVILSLRPVTFHYKGDTKNTPQFGLIAEDVAKVNPALVLPDKEGKPYTVRYDAVNAMLLNEFLKEHRKNEEQETKIEQQGATIAHQQEQVEALTAGLQKVSAQLAAVSSSHGELEVNKFATGRIRGGGAAPQIVLNNQ